MGIVSLADKQILLPLHGARSAASPYVQSLSYKLQ